MNFWPLTSFSMFIRELCVQLDFRLYAPCSKLHKKKRNQVFAIAHFQVDHYPQGPPQLCSILKSVVSETAKITQNRRVRLSRSSSSSWWLNQPIWKICSSNWKSSQKRDENQKYLSCSCHHLVFFLRFIAFPSHHCCQVWDSKSPQRSSVLPWESSPMPFSLAANQPRWTGHGALRIHPLTWKLKMNFWKKQILFGSHHVQLPC